MSKDGFLNTIGTAAGALSVANDSMTMTRQMIVALNQQMI